MSGLDEKPCVNAIERYRQGIITLEELAHKVDEWARNVIKEAREKRLAILAELRKGIGDKTKGASK